MVMKGLSRYSTPDQALSEDEIRTLLAFIEVRTTTLVEEEKAANQVVNPFGDINFVFEELDRLGVGNLPSLAAESHYNWYDLLYSFWSVFFCGGDCSEDLSINLKNYLPFLRQEDYNPSIEKADSCQCTQNLQNPLSSIVRFGKILEMHLFQTVLGSNY